MEQVVFEQEQASRRALNLDKALLGKINRCEAAACANGVTFVNAIDAVLPEVIRGIRFHRAEELAKARFGTQVGNWCTKGEGKPRTRCQPQLSEEIYGKQ